MAIPFKSKTFHLILWVRSILMHIQIAPIQTMPTNDLCSLSHARVGLSSEGCMDVSMDVIEETAPLPHGLSKEAPLRIPTTNGTFPPLNAALLKINVGKWLQ